MKITDINNECTPEIDFNRLSETSAEISTRYIAPYADESTFVKFILECSKDKLDVVEEFIQIWNNI